MSEVVLPTDPKERKDTPLVAGVIDYFPAALAEVARVSRVANEQHNPGQPLHWAWGKSNDHADCIVRHLIDRGAIDSDGLRHTAKIAWRALALLQEELVNEGAPLPRAAWTDDDDDKAAGEIMVADYDEWLEFQRWKQGPPASPAQLSGSFGYVPDCTCTECTLSRKRGEPVRQGWLPPAR